MRTVYKYELQPNSEIEMPRFAIPRAVMAQGMKLFLWAEVETSNKPEKRLFKVFGTGHELPIHGLRRFVGTAQMGEFVWHVYETDKL